MGLNFFVKRTKELEKREEGLHPDELKAREYGWTYDTGYGRGQRDGDYYHGKGFYKTAFPRHSEAMRGYRDGFDDAKRKGRY